MKVYTKGGDAGFTSLLNNSRVSKTDDRIELLGTIDELNSHLGLAKVVADEAMKEEIGLVQRTLMKIMAGIASSASGEYKLDERETLMLEEKIDRMEASFSRAKEFVLYGGSEISARLDLARAVARRAERQFCRVAKYHDVDIQAQKYLNRLADYLYICARYADYEGKHDETEEIRQEVIRQVLKEMGHKVE